MKQLLERGGCRDQVGIERCDDGTDRIDELRRVCLGSDENGIVLQACFG